MKILMRSAAAKRRAAELYLGDSLPLSAVYPEDRPLSVDWWMSSPQPESTSSSRHIAALVLYLEVARSSKVRLSSETFPAIFDFEDEKLRPDKGAMKVFLGEHLLEGRMMVAQLVFDLTDAGKRYLSSQGY